MKRIFVFVLICLLISISLTGCGKETPPTEVEAPMETTTEDAPVVVEQPTEAVIEESPTEDVDASSNPIVQSFSRVTTLKGDVFMALQEAIAKDDTQIAMMMNLLEAGIVDLDFVILPFLDSPEAASLLGNTNCVVNELGDNFTINLTNSANETLESGGEYDEGQDSLIYSVMINGEPLSMIEYVQVNADTYAMQYYIYRTKHTIRMYFDKNDIAVGIMTHDTPSESIYKKPPANGFEFAKNDEFYILYKDGKIAEAVSNN